MNYLNLETFEKLKQLEEKFKQLKKEAEEAFAQENLSDEHKAEFNRANEAYLKAHKEWQDFLHKNAAELLAQKL